MKLLLPLHKYDEAGRVKPSFLLYLILFFLCRPILVFIASISLRQDQVAILSLFYPDKYHFYMALIHAAPALIVLALISYREKLWVKERILPFAAIPWLLAVAIVSDLLIQLYILRSQQFAFEWTYAVGLIGAMISSLYLTKSRHIKVMLSDWSASE